ncbi:MAG TPA: hypothetical protein VKT74_07200 [Gammaproteobacteria bacterium]|nr:hypothetical protein [Gammaproteobacteria bacterium]
MLREIADVRQIEGEPLRRWFTDEHFDLVVWINETRDIVAFQLCYDKMRSERALTWKVDSGFTHDAVDDGENREGRYKATPILVPDGVFDPGTVAAKFLGHSGVLDSKSCDFIYLKLLEYPNG